MDVVPFSSLEFKVVLNGSKIYVEITKAYTNTSFRKINKIFSMFKEFLKKPEVVTYCKSKSMYEEENQWMLH